MNLVGEGSEYSCIQALMASSTKELFSIVIINHVHYVDRVHVCVGRYFKGWRAQST